MIEKLHDHLLDEMKTNTRTDTIFIIAAISLNLITLAVNSAVAATDNSAQKIMIFSVFTMLVIVVNLISIFGLMKGRQTRTKLLEGLMMMYKDQKVSKYYDPSIMANYSTRYILFTTVVSLTGLVAILVPLILII